MKPYYQDGWLTLYGGDCRAVLASMDADSVDCVVTSPPYWGLRDYGHDGQLGLERTPEEYVANMVAVFREVRRVLKPSGTCWLNLGDSYAGSGKGGNPEGSTWSGFVGSAGRERAAKASAPYLGLAQKQLVGIPWRVAFALQADGWYLRSDIIWSKPNPMPESVTDRPTKSHEYLFLLTKSARYYFDGDSVREPVASSTIDRLNQANLANQRGSDRVPGKTNGPMKAVPPGHYKHSGDIRIGREAIANPNRVWSDPDALERMAGGRNVRSVWTIPTIPYKGAHFAVFPPELPERCIKAGSPSGGLVMDPFGGSGTVGMVANRLSRRAILIDLNPEYLEQQMRRNAQTPLGLDVPA